MTRTKQYRRNKERVKDLRRRHLYRNNAINGRYELSYKEDPNLSLCAVHNKANPNWKLVEWTAQRETVHPDKLTNDIGHWQEYPKTKYYGSKGYYRMKGWRCRAFKEKVLRELTEREKNIQEND